MKNKQCTHYMGDWKLDNGTNMYSYEDWNWECSEKGRGYICTWERTCNEQGRGYIINELQWEEKGIHTVVHEKGTVVKREGDA